MIIDPARIQGFEDFLAPAEHAHNLFLMLRPLSGHIAIPLFGDY